jgi:hypothetical protein
MARGHSELTRQINGKMFPQRILPNARTFVNIIQHLRDFRVSKPINDLGRQREFRVLVTEKKFFTKLKISHEQVLGVLHLTWEL